MMTKEFTDPFEKARQEEGALVLDMTDETIPLILRFSEVRSAAKDWQTYSSDAPFRVPVPAQQHLRAYRQLPIETDPPAHTNYRTIVEPIFRQPMRPEYIEKVEGLIGEMLSEALEKPGVEVVNDFALPLQSRALTFLLGVPLEHAELFISWGNDALRYKEIEDEVGAENCDAYVKRQLERAEEQPGDDLFSKLNEAEYEGRKLTQEEKAGFANLVFAGGRDTIINYLACTLHYLTENPKALEQIREDRTLINSATEEFVRFFSPLTFIGRVCPHGAQVHQQEIKPDERAGLCWYSANMDETVFKDPKQVKLDRRPNPHVAFGSGPHNCLGAPQARLIMRTLLGALADKVASVEALQAIPSIEVGGNHSYERPTGFSKLRLKFNPLAGC